MTDNHGPAGARNRAPGEVVTATGRPSTTISDGPGTRPPTDQPGERPIVDRPGWLEWMHWPNMVHLLYLLNMFWQPGFDPHRSWVDWAVVAAIAVAFTPLWVLAHHPDRDVASRALWATVALATVGTVFNVGAAVLFVHATAIAAFTRRDVRRWQFGTTALALMAAAFAPLPWQLKLWVTPAIIFIWIIGWQAEAEAATVDEAQRLRIDNLRIEQLATANERERIARDLHDLLGQGLTGLVVQAQLLGSVADDPAATRTQAGQLEQDARAVLAQLRTTLDDMDEIDLQDEIDRACAILGTAGVRPVVTTPAHSLEADAAPGSIGARCLALAVREATTNVVRHARATTCHISLSRLEDVWRLEVSDDGIGGASAQGNGLRGMRERALAVGGHLQRHHDDGTTIVVQVPA